jgi:hypothetical protein
LTMVVLTSTQLLPQMAQPAQIHDSTGKFVHKEDWTFPIKHSHQYIMCNISTGVLPGYTNVQYYGEETNLLILSTLRQQKKTTERDEYCIHARRYRWSLNGASFIITRSHTKLTQARTLSFA